MIESVEWVFHLSAVGRLVSRCIIGSGFGGAGARDSISATTATAPPARRKTRMPSQEDRRCAHLAPAAPRWKAHSVDIAPDECRRLLAAAAGGVGAQYEGLFAAQNRWHRATRRPCRACQSRCAARQVTTPRAGGCPVRLVL